MEKIIINLLVCCLFVAPVVANEFLAPVAKTCAVTMSPSSRKKTLNTLREEIVTICVAALDDIFDVTHRIANAPKSYAQIETIGVLSELGKVLLQLSREIIENDKKKIVNRASKKTLTELLAIVEELRGNIRSVQRCLPSVPLWVKPSVKSLQKYTTVVD